MAGVLKNRAEQKLQRGHYLDLGVDTEQGEEGVHVYERLPGLSVHGAQEVEGKGELEEQAVHHDQVSHRHRTCHGNRAGESVSHGLKK